MRLEGILLINKLAELASCQNAISEGQLDRLKSLFLMFTSSSSERVQDIDNLGYETIDENDGSGSRTGLVIKSSQTLLSDSLMDLLDVGNGAPDIDSKEFKTTIFAAWSLAKALEWSSFDAKPFTIEQAESLSAALVRALHNVRLTGEP